MKGIESKTPKDVCGNCGKEIKCDAGQWFHVETQFVFCFEGGDLTEAQPKAPPAGKGVDEK